MHRVRYTVHTSEWNTLYNILCIYSTVNASELLNYIYIYIIQASECQHFIIFCEGKKKHLMPADFLVSGKGYRYCIQIFPPCLEHFQKKWTPIAFACCTAKLDRLFSFYSQIIWKKLSSKITIVFARDSLNSFDTVILYFLFARSKVTI